MPSQTVVPLFDYEDPLRSDGPKNKRSDRIQRLKDLWEQERSQRLLWVPISMACGAGAYFSLPFEPPISLSASLLALMLGLYVVLPPIRSGFLLLCAFLAAFTVAQVKTQTRDVYLIASALPAKTYLATVDKIEKRVERGWRLHLSNLAVPGDDQLLPAKVRIVSRTKVPEDLKSGHRISMRAVLTPLPRPILPGSYDFGRRLYLDGYGATGFTVSNITLLSGPREDVATSMLERQQSHVRASIDKTLSGASAGLAKALLLGDKSGVPQRVKDDFRRAGLAHLLAISGLHMALVAGFVFLFVRQGLSLSPRLALVLPLKSIAAGLTICALLGYLMLVGAPISAQRATFMAVCVMVAIIVGRNAISLRTAALAALFLLLFWPENVVDIGFQMSFAAVVALISGYEAAAGLFSKIREQFGSIIGGAIQYGLGIMLSTILAEIAVLPLSLYHFNEITVYGLIGNALAVPITGFVVMPAGLIGLLLMPLGLETPAFFIMGLGLDLMTAMTQDIARAPGAYMAMRSPSTHMLLAFMFAGLWLCLWRTKIRYLTIPILAVAPVFAFSEKGPTFLLSPSANAVAVRTHDDGYVLLQGRRSGFAAEVWAREMGQTSFENNRQRYQVCDALGCLISLTPEKDGGLAAIARNVVVPSGTTVYRFDQVKHPMGMADACERADLVLIDIETAPPCEGGAASWHVTTLGDKGPAKAWISADGRKDSEQAEQSNKVLNGISVKTVYARDRNRPWSPQHLHQSTTNVAP